MKKTEVFRERFKLSKVKALSGYSGLDITFETEDVQGDIVYREKDHKNSTKEPHPDLIREFTRLKPILCRIYHFTFIRELIKKEEFKGTEKQSLIAERTVQEIMQLVEITGISISGEDEGKGVIITGTLKAPTNQKMAINSHRLKMDKIIYGFEDDLADIVSNLENECFEYLFNDKKAQLTIEFDQDER